MLRPWFKGREVFEPVSIAEGLNAHSPARLWPHWKQDENHFVSLADKGIADLPYKVVFVHGEEDKGVNILRMIETAKAEVRTDVISTLQHSHQGKVFNMIETDEVKQKHVHFWSLPK